MNPETADRVLIGGGGIAGLAVARALHRRGIPSLTLERRDEPAAAGLAINLPGNAVQALDALGLGEELRGLGQPLARREYRDAADRLIFRVDEEAFWGARARPRCLRRADLLRLLRRGLPEEAVRQGRGLAAVRQDPGGVAAVLSDGTAETGGLLVGADGVHSTVRRAVFGGAAPEAARLAGASWRFMIPNPGVEAWTLWSGGGGLFLLIPVDRGEAYGWVAVTGAAPAGDALGSVAPVFARFPRRVREALAAALARPSSLHHSPLEEVRAPRWHAGRVLLAGDAAHATAPVWAQGAALALEDALVLARVLDRPAAWGEAGAAYERLRRPRVAHVQAMTDRMSRAARMPDLARRLLLPFLGPRSYRATYGPLRRPVTG
ncbi:FAD-dependent monooxygenase [Methylobacterium sp. WSM2598]|uniref:FAD-dependent monooxygenase n=1 Tax=Methylobacterium sp. WSM2598 TaxID=398261 RepID=UPI00037D13F7|nr:FAD-dependent monooxygenase [Methylobacterium sp. WSM2598]